MKPFFSLIIPIYNVEQYIRECLDSIKSQTFEDWEVICVVDGSPDQSAVICKEYAKKDKRFKVIEQPNQGPSAARNTGLLNTQGKYVHFVDPDDRLPGNQVYEKIHQLIAENNCDVLVGRSNYYQNTFDNFVEKGIAYDLIQEDYNSLSYVLENNLFFALTSGVNKVYRRSMLIDNNLFWPNVTNEDDRWLPKVMNASKKIIFTTEDLYDVRRRAESLTSTRSNERMSRRGLDYMQMAFESLELISSCKEISESALKNGMEYYIQLYFTGFKMNKDYEGNEKGSNKIISYMKSSKNVRMRGIYLLSKIFGRKCAFEVMKRRYKIV